MNHKAIYKLYPQVVTVDDGTGAFDKDGNKVEIDLSLVDAWVDPEAYKDLRAKEYPAISDQLDYIYHNGIDAWKTDMIDPVKTKYPKGTV
jgi:hypothetical protein